MYFYSIKYFLGNFLQLTRFWLTLVYIWDVATLWLEYIEKTAEYIKLVLLHNHQCQGICCIMLTLTTIGLWSLISRKEIKLEIVDTFDCNKYIQAHVEFSRFVRLWFVFKVKLISFAQVAQEQQLQQSVSNQMHLVILGNLLGIINLWTFIEGF